MIAIIGGGVAGLVAAINLENSGLECMIIEKQSYLGGRVGTDLVNEVPLDHGFQVLLTDYPYAHKYLDYSKLDLNTFSSGAVIYKDGRKNKFGDPIRNLSMLLPMLSSWVGTFSDKLKIYNLSRKLGLKSVESIFEESETTTLSYLQSYGFSKKVIDNFFKPFFGGIFLESELSTSSRMFEFVFKMFAYGSAAVPKKGMQEIPKQLRECLKKTKFVLGTSAEIAENGEVMVDGKAIAVRGIVKAYAEKSEWNGCSTLYYKVNQRILEGKIIGLLVDKNTVINSFHYVTDGILSVTCLSAENIDIDQSAIDREVKENLGISSATLIKRYDIPRSLPKLASISADNNSKLKFINNIPVALAGDHLYYGSLNAAMYSGEVAAQTIIDEIGEMD